MLNPSTPNVTREIHLKYVTDENGDMEINIDSSGFEDDPSAVAVFLSATISCFSEIDSSTGISTE